MNPTPLTPTPAPAARDSALAVWWVFLRLGLTSFGGPVTHIGFFRQELVQRRAWLSDAAYTDLVALCQSLPGPASSQVGMAMGLMRAGYPGLLAAWLGFTLPSALMMLGLAAALTHGLHTVPEPMVSATLWALAVFTIWVVGKAVWGMAQSLCPDTPRRWMMAVAALVAWAWSSPMSAPALMVLGALAGRWWCRDHPLRSASDAWSVPVSRRAGARWLALWALGLLVLPWWATTQPHALSALADTFYRAGSWVFGGGHVVLPLLETELVGPEGLSAQVFLAGYGAAQAVPGPLFTLSAFLGSVMPGADGAALGLLGGTVALLAIFLPAAMLLIGALPFWSQLRQHPALQAALMGTNATVVGILLAGWVHAITHGLLGR